MQQRICIKFCRSKTWVPRQKPKQISLNESLLWTWVYKNHAYSRHQAVFSWKLRRYTKFPCITIEWMNFCRRVRYLKSINWALQTICGEVTNPITYRGTMPSLSALFLPNMQRTLSNSHQIHLIWIPAISFHSSSQTESMFQKSVLEKSKKILMDLPNTEC